MATEKGLVLGHLSMLLISYYLNDIVQGNVCKPLPSIRLTVETSTTCDRYSMFLLRPRSTVSCILSGKSGELKVFLQLLTERVLVSVDISPICFFSILCLFARFSSAAQMYMSLFKLEGNL